MAGERGLRGKGEWDSDPWGLVQGRGWVGGGYSAILVLERPILPGATPNIHTVGFSAVPIAFAAIAAALLLSGQERSLVVKNAHSKQAGGHRRWQASHTVCPASVHCFQR